MQGHKVQNIFFTSSSVSIGKNSILHAVKVSSPAPHRAAILRVYSLPRLVSEWKVMNRASENKHAGRGHVVRHSRQNDAKWRVGFKGYVTTFLCSSVLTSVPYTAFWWSAFFFYLRCKMKKTKKYQGTILNIFSRFLTQTILLLLNLVIVVTVTETTDCPLNTCR